MRLEVDRNMATGSTKLNRRSTDIIGNNLKDPFYDSYQEEALLCCDIIDLIERSDEIITLSIGKVFLKKIIHSYIFRIRELEKDLVGRKYEH